MMTTDKKFHFISGLPRSGSTLLSSILNQNPKFSAGISSALLQFIKGYIDVITSNSSLTLHISNEKLKDLIIDLFYSYYKNDNQVCFNTNRGWTSEVPLIKDVFPDSKMIVCMRSVPWILDSFERQHRKNPYTRKPIYNEVDLLNVYGRSHALMGNNPNMVGQVSEPLSCLQDLVYSEEGKSALYINYNSIAQHPKEVMKLVYEYLEEDYYEHDFNAVGANYDVVDNTLKTKGLHTVRNTVSFNKRKTILPLDLWNMYSEYTFWLTDLEAMANLKYIHTDEDI
jgi:sulfotransferase